MKRISIKKTFLAALFIVFVSKVISDYSVACAVLVAVGLSLKAISSLFVETEGVLSADGLQINDTTWSGPAVDYMVTRAVTSTDTLDKGVAYVMQDISKKGFMVPRVDVTLSFQRYTPTPVSAGNITVDGRPLVLSKYIMYIEFNPQDFEQHYFEQLMGNVRTIDEVLPMTAENFIMMMAMKRVNEYFDYQFWNSHESFDPEGANVSPVSIGYPDNSMQEVFNAIFYNGFIQKALADASTQKLAWAAGNTSPANLRANVLDPMYAKILSNPISRGMAYKYGSKGLKYIFSYDTQSNYELALQRDTFKNIQSDEAAYVQYRKYDTVPIAGLVGDTTFLSIARPDLEGNFFIGMNTIKDLTLDMKKVSNPSDLWYLKGIFRMDVNHAFGDQMCLYTPITA